MGRAHYYHDLAQGAGSVVGGDCRLHPPRKEAASGVGLSGSASNTLQKKLMNSHFMHSVASLMMFEVQPPKILCQSGL